MKLPICPRCSEDIPRNCWDSDIEIWECPCCDSAWLNEEIALWTQTIAHFEQWSQQIELEDGGNFRLDPWERIFIKDLLTGVPEIWAVVPEESGKTSIIAVAGLYH